MPATVPNLRMPRVYLENSVSEQLGGKTKQLILKCVVRNYMWGKIREKEGLVNEQPSDLERLVVGGAG